MSNSGPKEKVCIRKLIQKTMNITKAGIAYRRSIFKNPVCVCWSRNELRKIQKIMNENKPGNVQIVSEILKISREIKKEDDLLEIEHKLRTVDLADRNEVQDEQPDDVVKKGDGMNMDMVE